MTSPTRARSESLITRPQGRRATKPKRSSLSTLRFERNYLRVGLRLFVGDAGAPTVELSLGEDSFLPGPLSSLVGLLESALVVSVAILPPSFSHRSSIFFFRRFLAIGSAIVVSSLLFIRFK